MELFGKLKNKNEPLKEKCLRIILQRYSQIWSLFV